MANLNLWLSASRLALDYMDEIASSLRETDRGVRRQPEAESLPPLVLEASAGTPAVGAFLVHNRLGSRVEAPLQAGKFVADGGREAAPEIRFEPATVKLDPGQQSLVRFLIKVDELAPGVDYRGELQLPGLPNGSVSLVVRRLRRARRSAAGSSL
jgi:hypothetical protein